MAARQTTKRKVRKLKGPVIARLTRADLKPAVKSLEKLVLELEELKDCLQVMIEHHYI